MSARHHRSKVLRNNPDIIITEICKLYNGSDWYCGRFTPRKNIDVFKAGKSYPIYGFRPRRIAG